MPTEPPRVLFVADGTPDDGLAAGLPPGAVVSADRRRLNPLSAVFDAVLGNSPPLSAEVLHAHGPRAVLATGLAAYTCRQPMRFVYSGVGPSPAWHRTVARMTFLKDADLVVSRSATEDARYRRLGVPDVKLRRVPYSWRATDGRPAYTGRSPTIIALGDPSRAADLQCALWAFDALRYARPDVHLVIAGAGPDRPRLERYARHAAFDDYRVSFADDPPLTGAAQVWVPHRLGGCRHALDALAAGVPLLAADTPDLREVAGDAARYFPPGDRGSLCQTAFRLLADPPDPAPGLVRAAEFPPERLAAALAAVYHEVGALPAD